MYVKAVFNADGSVANLVQADQEEKLARCPGQRVAKAHLQAVGADMAALAERLIKAADGRHKLIERRPSSSYSLSGEAWVFDKARVQARIEQEAEAEIAQYLAATQGVRAQIYAIKVQEAESGAQVGVLADEAEIKGVSLESLQAAVLAKREAELAGLRALELQRVRLKQALSAATDEPAMKAALAHFKQQAKARANQAG